jgi:acyl-coenzyme A thioesterase PaaI-like protein
VDATAVASSILEPIPAHDTLGLRVLSAIDGVGEVEMTVLPNLLNVIGSLHSSGLLGLIDFACLAAIISTAERAEQVPGIGALGAQAEIDFRAPARGRLVARSELAAEQQDKLRALWTDSARSKLTLTTGASVVDQSDVVVCAGSFTWSLRRTA